MIKKILISAMLIVPCLSFAQKSDDDFTTDQYKHYIKEQLIKATDDYKKINNECLKTTDGKSLSKQTVEALEHFNLTERQVASILGIHIMERQLNCVGQSPSRLIAYLKESEKIGIKTPDEVSQAINSILMDQLLLIRYKYYYSLLPESIKKKVDELEELKKPFSIMAITQISTKE